MTAVDELYSAYAAVPLNPGVEFCDHCVTEAEVRALHGTPLRELTAEQLGPLLFNSTTTWGDIAYLRHFLPRLLELTASGAMNDWSYPSFLPRRLLLSREHDTPDQAAAMTRWFADWWSRTLATWPPACDAAEVYDTLTEVGVPAPRLLDEWRSAPALAGARHLAAFVEMELTIIGIGKPRVRGLSAGEPPAEQLPAEESSASTGEPPAGELNAGGLNVEAQQLRDWLLGPTPQELLTAVGDTDDEVLEEVTDALPAITEARAA